MEEKMLLLEILCLVVICGFGSLMVWVFFLGFAHLWQDHRMFVLSLPRLGPASSRPPPSKKTFHNKTIS